MMALSAPRALALSTWTDRTSILPEGRPEELSVVFEIEAHGVAVDGVRRPARTVLAIDVSLSMKGEPLEHVIRSVDRLLDALGPEDEVGVVAFSEGATRVVEPVRVDVAGKRLVRSRVGRLYAAAGTNIEAGLDLSAAMMAGAGPAMRRGVVLLSDGAPNVGAHTAEALREVVRRYRPDVSFFSLGYGVDHSEDVLSTIGDAGGGGYEYVPDPATCARAFARALGTQGDVVASGIELVVTPADGVELARFVGREQTRYSREGIVVSLPDMVNGSQRLVVAQLTVRPPGAQRFTIELATATARWRAPGASEVSTLEQRASIEVADRPPRPRGEAVRRVLLVRADEARETSRSLADRGQFAAAATGLRHLMREIEQVEGFQPNDGSPLAEAYELLVDEAMAFERRPSPEQYAAFRKATASSRLASRVPVDARSRGDASQKLIEHVAGDRPPAWLVTVGSEVRFPLHEEVVIGRTSRADIQVPSAQVSRRHAEVFASGGEYWISDLGSTNPTIVNGSPLARSPHKLAPGDIVRVGDVELRYEEDPRESRS